MKSDNLLLFAVIGVAAYYLYQKGVFSSGGPSAMAPLTSGGGPVYAPIASQPGLAIQITSNPNTVVPGTSTAYNQYLPPSQQVNPADPPPIICQAGQWPTRDSRFAGGWICATPAVRI